MKLKKEKSIQEIVSNYLNNNPILIEYASRGLINYSALARDIKNEYSIKKSNEAIIMAIHRFFFKIKIIKKKEYEKTKKIINESFVNIKSNYCVCIIDITKIENNIDTDAIISFGKIAVLIGQKQNLEKYKNKCNYFLDKLFLIEIKHGKNIEENPGVMFHLLSKLYEKKINIVEIFSAWDTTYLLIENKWFEIIIEVFFKKTNI